MPKLPMALFSIDTSSYLEKAAHSSGIFENAVESTRPVAGNSAADSNRARVPFAA
jgi:hypothetical protein